MLQFNLPATQDILLKQNISMSHIMLFAGWRVMANHTRAGRQNDNLADTLTKPLPSSDFKKFRALIGVQTLE
jgi:hypothetical protein